MDRVDQGLVYKIIGGFDRDKAIGNGQMLIDATLKVMKVIFSIYPKSIDMPVTIDYKCGMMVRNMLIWAIFRYTHPQEIEIDTFDLLLTQDGQAFFQSFICPCGGTLTNFHSHWKYLRKKNEETVPHIWFFDTYSDFTLAIKGKHYD